MEGVMRSLSGIQSSVSPRPVTRTIFSAVTNLSRAAVRRACRYGTPSGLPRWCDRVCTAAHLPTAIEIVKAAVTVRTARLQIDALAAHVFALHLVFFVPAPDRAELAEQIPYGVMDGRLAIIRAALKMRRCVEVGAVVGEQADGDQDSRI